MVVRKFNLNIEKILEDWEVYHAIREVIANAIDEYVLTKTKQLKYGKTRRVSGTSVTLEGESNMSISHKKKMMKNSEIYLLLVNLE